MKEPKLKDADSTPQWAIAVWKRDFREMVVFVVMLLGLVLASHYIGFRVAVLTVLAMLLADWFED